MNKKIKHYSKAVYASLAAGLASSIVLLLIAMPFVGLNEASTFIFKYLTILIFIFGVMWFPYINKNIT